MQQIFFPCTVCTSNVTFLIFSLLALNKQCYNIAQYVLEGQGLKKRGGGGHVVMYRPLEGHPIGHFMFCPLEGHPRGPHIMFYLLYILVA